MQKLTITRQEIEQMELSEELKDNSDKIRRENWKKQIQYSFLFSEKNLDNFDSNLQPKAFKVIKEYDLSSGKSILLFSPEIYGVGKTHLAYGLIDRYLKEYPATYKTSYGIETEMPCPVYFTTENKLLSRIRMTYQDGALENEEQIYTRLRGYQMIIIDDVGKVKPQNSAFLQNAYLRIIDDRYNDKKAVMVTTNLGLEDLELHLGGATADRLRGMCGDNIVKMIGKTQRYK